MSAESLTDPVEDALARLEQAVNDLSTLSMDSGSDGSLLEIWKRREVVARRLDAIDQAITAQVDSRSLASTYACRNTAALARLLLNISSAEAQGRVKAARNLGPRRSLTGEPLGPIYPAVAAAQAEGAISARHVRIIVKTIEKLPDAIAAQCAEVVEKVLTDFAREHDPDLLARHARDVAYALDQDGQLKDDAYRDKHRHLAFHRRPDGSGRLLAELTAECAEHLETQLDALTKPVHVDGMDDVRSPGQRRHDALLTILKLNERAKVVPHAAGCTSTIVLTMDAEAYATGTGPATTGHGYTIPAQVAKRWAGSEARLIAVLLSKTKAITAYSSSHRIFTEQQRLALIARDKGCSFPGCTSSPQYCETHHVTEHQHSGRTSVDDGTLLCSFHHRHHEQAGWTCQMQEGTPWWTPPVWLDPDQTPRRNTTHDHTAHDHDLG